ncbi:MAG: CehA/McbA family metallohydrolase [Planctomycetes bacterium]|nr:CehA/McbA family metallohydrolase [Planctomycetota bacterium]
MKTTSRISFSLLLVVAGCSAFASAEEVNDTDIRKAVTVYASFDQRAAADRGGGGLTLSTRFNQEEKKVPYVFQKGFDADIFRIAKGKGIHGGALECTGVLPSNGRIFFPAGGNIAFKKGGWGGAVSVWVNTDPNELLKTRFCDPVQITQKGAGNGGIWFDFNDSKPRDLRMGVFPAVAAGSAPIKEDDPGAPIVRVKGIGFRSGDWHHVVLSWRNLDTGKKDAQAALYIDGELIGEVKDHEIAMDWDINKTGIYVAVNYIGLLDELAVFGRELTAAEVARLHEQPGLVASLKQGLPEDKAASSSTAGALPKPGRLRGEVIDAGTGEAIPARVYILGEDGEWHHVESADPAGSAVPYSKRRTDTNSVEIHTAVSAHPFVADLLPGRYSVTVERGKEYHPLTQQVTVGTTESTVQFKLRRWIDMAARGWYSGDTHVHRSLDELPTVMQTEDLNVAFPLLHWVHDAFTPPGESPVKGEPDPGHLIAVDATHVIYPRNTEYEIFTVGEQRHTLGAFFVLNHKTLLDVGVPPVAPVARKAREDGLIELDKHNWPWSMTLVPVMPVDLYELANNHVWRTQFGFHDFGEPTAEYMRVERTCAGWTEWGWIDFGFQNYYALLNCGFRLRPTAGTASGVHPVPLGFGRVYVHLPEGFRYDAWVEGLNKGRSFVTTGPMLFVELDRQPPGHVFHAAEGAEYRLSGSALSSQPLHRIEIVAGGEVVRTLKPENRRTEHDAFESAIDEPLRLEESAWIAVRCFEDRPDGRVRFAHTGPFHVEIAGKPLRPRKQEVEYLTSRVEEQIARSGALLPAAALDEYRKALQMYRQIAETAR